MTFKEWFVGKQEEPEPTAQEIIDQVVKDIKEENEKIDIYLMEEKIKRNILKEVDGN